MGGASGGIRPTGPQAGASAGPIDTSGNAMLGKMVGMGTGTPAGDTGGAGMVGRMFGMGTNNSTYTPVTSWNTPQPQSIDQQLARLTQGMPQAAPQSAPQQATMQQSSAPMPIFNQPATSPMQQYMQRMMPQQPMINRAQYDAGRYINDGSRGYAAWRAPQTFKPQLTPQQTAASAAAAKPQQSELDKLRAELEEMRSRQAGSNTNDGGGSR